MSSGSSPAPRAIEKCQRMRRAVVARNPREETRATPGPCTSSAKPVSTSGVRPARARAMASVMRRLSSSGIQLSMNERPTALLGSIPAKREALRLNSATRSSPSRPTTSTSVSSASAR